MSGRSRQLLVLKVAVLAGLWSAAVLPAGGATATGDGVSVMAGPPARGVAASLEEASWMAVDAQNRQVLVLTTSAQEGEGAPRPGLAPGRRGASHFLVLGLDGSLLSSHELPAAEPGSLPQVHYF